MNEVSTPEIKTSEITRITDPVDPYVCIVGKEAVVQIIDADDTVKHNQLDYSGMVPGGVGIKPNEPNTSFNPPA